MSQLLSKLAIAIYGRHSLSMFCVYCFHSAGHLLISPISTASFCALAARCNIRLLLSTAWAFLEGLVMQVSAYSYCIGFVVNSTVELPYNKLDLAVESLSSWFMLACESSTE